jgi:hypothetical protein
MKIEFTSKFDVGQIVYIQEHSKVLKCKVGSICCAYHHQDLTPCVFYKVEFTEDDGSLVEFQVKEDILQDTPEKAFNLRSFVNYHRMQPGDSVIL